MAGKTTIAWEIGEDLEAKVYVSESQAHAGDYPIDSRKAVAHLERLRAKGAQYLLFLPGQPFGGSSTTRSSRGTWRAATRVTVSREDTEDACIIFLCNEPHEHARLPDQADGQNGNSI